ncbi:LysR family transcriptional regulator [Actinoplanes sp. M2I2]|uniref:LysR family transcriptional regulator n=1 Tax=Actinoplanes sp. M2I2 TaxID=1734444 RepID=UPI0020208D4E|nr:LysR family transcriptional regulator [Actinoplanes sp. M2I2]
MDLRGLKYFVAVADERHIGRAAARLHMTQPPLSRAMRQLEADLGTRLLERTPTGVTLTAAGETLYIEARAVLERAEQLTARVRVAGGRPRITIGSLADTADLVGTRLVTPFRRAHPHVSVGVHEFDLTDPTAGLRSGVVDVALTRMPFDTTGLRTHTLDREPVGVVVAETDDLARRASVAVGSLTGRRWVRLPSTADPAWIAYWTGPAPDAEHPEVRTIQECLQSVLWDDLTALAPVNQILPAGLTTVRATDREPNRLVLAWRAADPSPLIHSFVDIAAGSFRHPAASRARTTGTAPST